MSWKRITFVLGLILFLGLLACSDDPVSPVTTGTVSGKVVDAVTGAALAGASITTTPATNAITTDSTGTYLIENVEEGKITIAASKTGYRNGIVSVNVVAGDTSIAIIQLEYDDVVNTVPNIPSNPSPANGAEQQPTSLVLRWKCSDPDVGDTLYYDVYLYNSGSTPQLLLDDGQVDSLKISGLEYGTTYFWQVMARDNKNGITNGPVWSFTVEPFPENPIVFALKTDGNYEVFSASPDTLDSHIYQITHNPSRDWWPRLSPDKSRLAFVSDRTVEPQIYTVEPNGNNLFRVTQVPVTGYHNYGMGFCWSPDGTRLLYSHYEKLYRIDVNGTDMTQIATAPAGRHFREVDWSPVDDKIVALTIGSWFYDSEIYLMDSDGGNMTQLIPNWAGAIESPSFSPDGRKIIFSYDVSGIETGDNRQLDTHIIILDIASGDTVDISQNKPEGTNDSNPRFSPDGSKVIFCNYPNNEPDSRSIWIMNLSGANRKKIISRGTMPDWE
ncbi:MAG: hypothetical protein Kow0037_02490 [Calditrichia bacterium]